MFIRTHAAGYLLHNFLV